MPLQPNRPIPSSGGTNAPVGLADVTQLAGLKYQTPARMKVKTMTSLMATKTVLIRADSRMPNRSTVAMTATTAMAGTLRIAPVVCHTPSAASKSNGELA